MRILDSESERATYRSDGRVQYSRRFAFTPVPASFQAVPEPQPLPTPPPPASDDNP